MNVALVTRAASRWALAAMTLVLSGCVTRPGWTKPAPTRLLPRAVAEAKQAAVLGQFDQADQRLAAFAEAFPNSREASETAFWRALLRLDPANPRASHGQASEMLDRYLASPQPRVYEVDAKMLRRTIITLEQQSKATVSGRTESEARIKEREEELQRTRNELATALAELERIKKRIASPKP